LVNGAEGIGTGWSTKIPNYNPREIIQNLRRMINGEETRPMKPFYKNFRGQIDQLDDVRVVTNGELAIIDDNVIEITELPIGTWTQAYKESVLEVMLHGEEKKPNPCITDYKEYHTDTTVRFVVKMTPEQFRTAEQVGLHKFFKLQKTLSLNSMVLFDHQGCLRRYESVTEILHEFYNVRMDLYKKRKEYLEGMLGAESLKLDNIARFILEKIEGKIKVENVKKTDICKMLRERGYNPDPVARWKERISKERGYDTTNDTTSAAPAVQAEEDDQEPKSNKDFDYLLGMPIWNLTTEKKDEILKQQKQKGDELRRLKAKSPADLWIDDLNEFLADLDKYEQKEKEEESSVQLKSFKAGQASKKAPFSSKKPLEYMPALDGVKIEPVIDPSLVSKTEKESKSKEKEKIKKEENKEPSLVDIIVNDNKMNDEQIAEYLKNLGAKKPKTTPTKKSPVKKEPKEPKEKKSNKNDDDSGDEDSSAKVKVKTEKGKGAASKSSKAKSDNNIENYFKKNKVESDNDGSDNDIDEDMSDSNDGPIEPRVIARARKEVKYDQFIELSDADSDSEKTKKKKKKKAVDSDEDDEIVLHDDDSDDDSYEFKKRKPSKSPKKAPPAEEDKKPVVNAFIKMKTAASKKTQKDEDTENKPPKKTKTEEKPAKTKTLKKEASASSLFKSSQSVDKPKATAKKSSSKKKEDSDIEEMSDDFIVESSEDDFEPKKKTAQKKKLMDKPVSTTQAKKPKNVIVDDDDLYSD
jgi:DNA topoisomerase-2